jgi:hypothetical protein
LVTALVFAAALTALFKVQSKWVTPAVILGAAALQLLVNVG